MKERVLETIRRHAMIGPGQKVGVAVSGGADSICLLHVLQELAPDLGITLTGIHLNHHLRGAESDADEAFVRAKMGSLGIPVIVESADLKGNIEQAGRNARLALFRKLLTEKAVNRVATGHTRSDQAETVLYRLIRGSGTAGLAGIRPVTREGIIRPLLDVERAGVLGYLRSREIAWREDASNADLKFVRNRIRHELLPMLQRDYNPAVIGTVSQMARIAADEESWWAQEIERIADGADLQELGKLHPAVQRRVIRHLIAMCKGDLRSIDAGHVESILELVGKQAGAGRIALPGVEVTRSFGRLHFSRAAAEPPVPFEIPLQLPGDVALPGTSQRLCFQLLEIASTSTGPLVQRGYNRDGDWLDADRLPDGLVLRNWRPGDVFNRPGHGGRTLKLLFQRNRIPSWERAGWPVISCGGCIVWARRFGVSSGYGTTAETRRVLVVSEGEAGQP